MNRVHHYRTRNAGHLEIITLTMADDNGTNTLTTFTSPRDRSINTNKFLDLEQTRGPMPQNTTVRASSKLACRNLVNERVQPGVPRSTHKRPDNESNNKEKEQKQSLLIASLNIRGK